MSSNPVFNRIEREAQQGYAGFERTGQSGAGAHASQDQLTTRQLEDLYNRQSAGPVDTGRISMDDVIMKTLGLFAIVLVFAFGGWRFAASNPGVAQVAMFGSIAITLVLGLVIAFMKSVNVPLIVLYAVAEGVLVGVVSFYYNAAFPTNSDEAFQGIVPQAVLATAAVFVGMLALYKSGVIKVTDKFRRIVTMAIVGYAIFALINFVYALVTNTPFGIGGSTPLGIGISLFAVGLASFSLALDFDSIDTAIRSGAPQKYSWLLAHGLIVTLVWLYLEMLRLLGRLRNN